MPVVLRAKCIVVGESTVGKTALVKCLQTDNAQFAKNYNMTTGVDISVKTLHIPDSEDIVELYIYDSSGKEIYTEYVQSFWDHPSVVLVVYDVSNEQAFQACSTWLERVKARKTSPDLLLPGVLLANKVDLKERRVVTEEQGKAFSKSKELFYCECSVRDQENTEKPFQFLAEEFYALYQTKSQQLQSLVV